MIVNKIKKQYKILAVFFAVIVLSTSFGITALAAPVTMPDGTVFDAEYYAANNPDVVAVYGTNADALYRHYVTYGKKEGRLPYAGAGNTTSVTTQDDSLFDAAYYAANNPDVVAIYGTNADALYQHYVTYGQKEGRLPYAPAGNANTATPVTAAAPVVTVSNAGRTTSSDASAYFAKTVFIGDSVMVGYRNYLASQTSSPVSSSIFLAATSYSAAHALNTNDSLHPMYKGQKQPVWTSISQMNVDRVFIMFGTNDLVVKDAGRASADVLALVDTIKAYNPGVEVHIISMTPVYAGTSKGALNNPTIQAYNLLLWQGAMARDGVYYIDLNSHLLDQNGDLVPRYCSDSYVHQTYASYSEVWDPVFISYALGE